MPSRPVHRVLAAALTSLLLAGCASDSTLAPRAALGVAGGPAAAVDDAADTASVLWSSDALWPGFAAESAPADAGLMSLTTLPAEPDIRIGVVQAAPAVVVGGTGSWVVRDRATGAWLGSGTSAQVATITLAAVPAAYTYFQVMCGFNITLVNERLEAAEALGYVTLTELAPAGCTRVLIGRMSTPNTAAQRDAYKATLIAQGLAASDAYARTITIGTQVLYKVTRATGSATTVNPVIVTASSGNVKIGTTTSNMLPYRGRGEVRINSAASLAGINELPIEQYLYGVLPKELGPIAYPEVEAQKAQAIAARTYAMVGRGKRAADGYDLRATTDDQVYGGLSVEHPVSNAAVDDTRGLVATYAGRMISTNFFSTSGGHTANNDEAFNGSPVAYLRGVPDAERGEALEHVPSLEVFARAASPKALRNAAEADFESDWASYHRWSYEWSAEEISAVVSTFAGRPVGRVLAITVTSRGPSGRALSVDYVTEAGTFTDARKDGIRGSLRYINASGARVNLPSTLFFVEPVRENGRETGGFRVYGGGFGHGVGMSQTGAVGMAQKGHTFREIIAHYYQETALEPAY